MSCHDFYYIREKNTIFNTTNSNMRQQINTPSNRTKVGLDLLAQASTLWTMPHKKLSFIIIMLPSQVGSQSKSNTYFKLHKTK